MNQALYIVCEVLQEMVGTMNRVIKRCLGVRMSFSFMVALCNTADHIYFHPVVCSFFFPRLISAVGDWMSAILPHMVWR